MKKMTKKVRKPTALVENASGHHFRHVFDYNSTVRHLCIFAVCSRKIENSHFLVRFSIAFFDEKLFPGCGTSVLSKNFCFYVVASVTTVRMMWLLIEIVKSNLSMKAET